MPNIELEVIANTSYAILLASYIMRDILWLRVLTVISLGFEIPYFYFQSNPLWDGIGWDFTFIAINVFWIARLVFERRPVHFTAEQKRLWETRLSRLQPRYARQLFKLGTHKSLGPNEIVVTQGETMDEISLISEGKVDVKINQKTIEELGPGYFIGASMFMDSENGIRSLATIVAVEPTRMMTWKHNELRKLIEDDSQFSMAIEATLGLELASLLRRAWNREAVK